MKVITLLTAGQYGGIESRCKDYGRLSKHDNTMLMLWSDEIIDEEMRALGIHVVNVHASRRNIFSAVHKVMKVVREEHGETLIAMHEASMSHLCLMYAKLTNRNIHTIAYATVNAVDMIRMNEKRRLWLRKAVIRASLNMADDVVAISESVKKSLTELLGTDPAKISVIYNGADLSRFPGKEEISRGEPCRLVYVGRLIREKGLQSILKALSEMDNRSRFSFRIVGEGQYQEELERLTDQLGLGDIVEFYGASGEVARLLSEADVFIHMPEWEEGFGIAVIEAMAVGLICVCAKSGAIPEIINDPSVGVLVDRNGTQPLIDALNRVYEMSTEERCRMSEAARRRAMDFSIENYVSNLDKMVEGKYNE